MLRPRDLVDPLDLDHEMSHLPGSVEAQVAEIEIYVDAQLIQWRGRLKIQDPTVGIPRDRGRGWTAEAVLAAASMYRSAGWCVEVDPSQGMMLRLSALPDARHAAACPR